MTAPHFFAGDVSGEQVVVEGEDARHAIRVMRLRPGERITVSDGRGNVVEAIASPDRDRLLARVTARRSEPAARPALRVFQAIPKAGKLDLVVQKLTELGVGSIHLFAAERSVPKWSSAKGNAHAERLGHIARQAAMQSRRAWLPLVAPPVPPALLDLAAPAVVLHEAASLRLSDALPSSAPEVVSMVVGPEGGLTEEEVSAFGDRGAEPVTLGAMILRTETAAIAAASLVLGRYGLLG